MLKSLIQCSYIYKLSRITKLYFFALSTSLSVSMAKCSLASNISDSQINGLIDLILVLLGYTPEVDKNYELFDGKL